MVECTGLENRRAARLRGFESLSLRHQRVDLYVNKGLVVCKVKIEVDYDRMLEVKLVGKSSGVYEWMETKTCPYCSKANKRLSKDFVFCPMCGERLPR